MTIYAKNGYKLSTPSIDRSTAAMPGQHSRGKDKAQRLREYNKRNYKNQSTGILRKVTVRDLELDIVETYMIVSSTEIDPDNNKISNESPLGVATHNKKVGEIVQVSAPCGYYKVEILETK